MKTMILGVLAAVLLASHAVAIDESPTRSGIDTARTNGIPPLAPSEAVKTLRTKPGFHAEIVVTEPLIESPVAISFGPDGRLWVAEMSDYPQGDGESGGRIRCVFDDDNDGRFDRSEVFLSGLPYPTGVTVWRNGVLVCAAPDILFAEDKNGDGKADRIEKLFTGFATHNFQARVNSLEYGLDGWVYGACGLFGGEITSLKTGELIALGQRDFRFHPDTGVLEPATGSTQQGRVRNDWDDWFGCNNETILMHYPLANQYLRRNPYLAPSKTVVSISAEPKPGRLYSIANQVLFMLSGPPNRPTAACGLGVYRDDLLGPDYHGDTFTCEPVNNLVHRQKLTASGVTFTGRRPEDELDREFLASTDPWFRPVQAHTGPDGALWIVDMYRYVIEHPIWIPPNTLATLDPRAGADRGRIYRIVADAQPARRSLRLNQLQGEELANAMDSPNGTQRDLVQQLIQWNEDKAALPALKKLAIESDRPEVRLQALSTWANMETPDAAILLKLLADKDPHVRRHAVRVAEAQLASQPALANAVMKLAADSDMFVRMQVAYSSAALQPADSATVLAKLLLSDGRDTHMTSAIQSSLSATNIVPVMSELRKLESRSDVTDPILDNAATLADESTVSQILAELASVVVQSPTEAATAAHYGRLAHFISAWRRRTSGEVSPGSDSMRAIWKPAVDSAIRLLESDTSPQKLRIAAVMLVGQTPFLGESHAETLATLLTPRTPPELQAAAINALRQDSSELVADFVLTDWATREPRLKKSIVAMLISRQAWTERLLKAMAEGTVSTSELDLPQQQQLIDHASETIRVAAKKTLKPRTSASRQQVIDRYVAALTNSGDASRGRQMFQKHCSNCHRLQDVGHMVGPDIAGYGGKPVQSLVIAMLDPNQAVDPRYHAYVVVLNDGRSVTGLIAEENASSLTLLAAEGKRETALRSEVEQMRSTGKSLMPEGFEQNASTTDVNDLWAFFKTLQSPPKKLEGNTPAVVAVLAEGNVVLPASTAEIYGGDITFELTFQNIGYWHNRNDIVRWRINSSTSRNVQVWGEWACDDSAAGGSFQIEGTQPSLQGVVGTTGGWDRYNLVPIGVAVISEGESELVVRPAEDLKSAMVDLRAIHLVAVGGVPLATGMVRSSGSENKKIKEPSEIAAALLDDAVPAADREKLIADSLKQAAEIIPLMAKGLPPEAGSKEEYRRIPWIWRVAIAAGKSGDNDLIRSVLIVSLPQKDQRLEHWQAVVIGGGLINGIGLVGHWPREGLTALVESDPSLAALWQRSLELSLPMSDDETVLFGTRYDALRMVAMQDWAVAGPQLSRYLEKGLDEELHMGAISGLSDLQHSDVAGLLISNFNSFSSVNRNLTIDALLRTPDRRETTIKALNDGQLPNELKQDERIVKLLKGSLR